MPALLTRTSIGPRSSLHLLDAASRSAAGRHVAGEAAWPAARSRPPPPRALARSRSTTATFAPAAASAAAMALPMPRAGAGDHRDLALKVELHAASRNARDLGRGARGSRVRAPGTMRSRQAGQDGARAHLHEPRRPPASSASACTVSTHRTGLVSCARGAAHAPRPRRRTASAVTFATTGNAGDRSAASASVVGEALPGRLHQRRVKRAAHLQRHHPLRAGRLEQRRRPARRPAAIAGDDGLVRRVEVRRHDHVVAAVLASAHSPRDSVGVQSHHRRHRPRARVAGRRASARRAAARGARRPRARARRPRR